MATATNPGFTSRTKPLTSGHIGAFSAPSTVSRTMVMP